MLKTIRNVATYGLGKARGAIDSTVKVLDKQTERRLGVQKHDEVELQEVAQKGYDNGDTLDVAALVIVAGVTAIVTGSAAVTAVVVVADIVVDTVIEYYFINNDNVVTRQVPQVFTFSAYIKNANETFNYIFRSGPMPSRMPSWVVNLGE